MKSCNISTSLLLFMLFFSVSRQQKLNFGDIKSRLKKLCLSNPSNYIKDPNVVTCKIKYDVSCWKETPAGQTAVQPCFFLLYLAKDNMSRRCDEQGQWGKINKTQCRLLKPKEAVETGKQTSNVSITTEEDDSLTHAERVQRVYVACSWVAFFVLLPTFIVLCIVMKRNERFTLHKNLILAFILRILTLFIFYHGKMGENESKKTVCNVFWLLNRYFAASEITWMLNEGIFLLRMLAYPFDNESYLWYYVLFGWGFSGVLTFCIYLPYVQFKIARVSESCWVSHSQTKHMLVLYVPLTIMLLINFGFAAYVIQVLLRKLKNSQSTHMNTIKKSSKAVVILISLLGMIYLLTFYQPGNNPAYNYFVAVFYPLQGVMVCIFCVYLSVEFRESFRKLWMKWRYGILIETVYKTAFISVAHLMWLYLKSMVYSINDTLRTEYSNSYSTTREIEAGPSGEQGTSASVLHESSDEIPPRARSIASLQDTSRPPSAHPPEQLKKQNTQRSLLSRSGDLTKYRLKKVEPEPLKPVRVQSAGPEAWCPPTLQAATAWQEIELSENRDDPSSSNQGLENEGFSAKSESELSQLDNQTSPELEIKVVEQPINNTEEHTKESLTSNSKDTFSFSSQLFEPDTRPSTAEISGESAGVSELPENETSGGEALTATAGSSISQDAEPSTSTEESSTTSFWDKARELATQRRRSRIEQNRVLSTDEDSLHLQQKYADMQKNAAGYRLAWISKILKGDRSHENESDA